MTSVIDVAVGRARTVMLAFVIIFVAGVVSYNSMPKEAEPDIAFPFVNIAVTLEGVSPEDAERLLVRPLEQELRTIAGVKEMVASAMEGRASISLEFQPEVNIDQALIDVREKVDIAKAKLPQDAEEPRVAEIKFSRFDPMLVMTLTGDAPERALYAVADAIKDRVEAVTGVLEVVVVGAREELLEIIINPLAMESYGLSPGDVLSFVERNNRLVAAGALQAEQGRFAVKVPGVIETPEDILNLPIKADEGRVVRFKDIATVRRTYKDAESFARLNGDASVGMEVVARTGANILTTTADVKAAINEITAFWPPGVKLTYTRDKSFWVKKNISSLVNSVTMAIVLVFIVLISILGIQNSLLVGIAIPGSFCAAFFFLNVTGLSINMVTLFGAIMAVGMLVDGAIVVTELADRKMAEGIHRRVAYADAAKRMSWPIIASTGTTLAAFLPLLFWPGLTGRFMVYLPLMLIYTLSASLLMALVFVPTIGTLIGRPGHFNERIRHDLLAAETGDLKSIGGMTGRYIRVMESATRNPWSVVGLVTLLTVGIYLTYGALGKGVSMWPEVEPNQGSVDIRALGDLSVTEKDQFVRSVEERIYGIEGVNNIYVRSGKKNQGGAPDEIGSIRLNFADWRARRPAKEIIAEIEERVADLPGLVIEARLPQEGPGEGKPIKIEASGQSLDALKQAVNAIRAEIETYPGVVNAEDTRPVPGIEWRLIVDRAEAAKFGADVTLVGSIIQLVTNGIKLGDYRPDDSDEEIDIRVRFPSDSRSLDQLGELRIPTQRGNVPISTFVKREAASATTTIMRTDMRRTMLVQADLKKGTTIGPVLERLEERLPELDLDPGVQLDFKGGARDQAETASFLLKAAAMAMGLMAIILVTQFNSIFQALLILTAVVFSTGGILFGLMITGHTFSLVNCGIGAIALAGIVVNNNIVLIDTYNKIRESGMRSREAIIRTCAQRLRPVMLTTVTTVLGLLPMAMAVNVDLLNRDVYIGGPGGQWWKEMASAIAGGLVFATILTLLLTPSLLMIQANVSRRLRIRREQKKQRIEDEAALAG
ncbi:MAG: efflux RND transporter permease subunit [Gammaproteobacteria bacterium]|nr:efflux RND transporter permease subunit [Gammaproteobacteria bacterium]